jgi:ribosome-associated protein
LNLRLPTDALAVSPDEVEFCMIRAQGAGGQNVNKVSCAVHLHFDVGASSLPDAAKHALLACNDQRVSKAGVVIIKAQLYRSLELNKQDALARLNDLLAEVCTVQKLRKPSKPTYGSKQRRLKGKTQRGKIKALRGKIDD